VRRHPEIFVLRAEATLLARVRDLAKASVYHFLMSVHRRKNNIDASQVYSVEQTEMSTVDRLHKVLACKIKHQVIAITSGQQGTKATLMCCMSSSVSYVPPVMIFKRMELQDELTA